MKTNQSKQKSVQTHNHKPHKQSQVEASRQTPKQVHVQTQSKSTKQTQFKTSVSSDNVPKGTLSKVEPVVVVGAGMAGLIGAIYLARNGVKVTILEANDKIGKKLLMTGNGRCNLTNRRMDASHYHSSSKNLYSDIIGSFSLEDTELFLYDLGIDLVELDEGKMYPMSLQASSVIKSLLFECERLNIHIEYGAKVDAIEFDKNFLIVYKRGQKDSNGKVTYTTESVRSKYVLIATGGKSYADTGSDGNGFSMGEHFGHHIVRTYPSIVQVKTDSPYNKSLKGFKCDCIGSLYFGKDKLRTEQGEVLWTDYGLSGPVILQLSTMIGSLINENLSLTIGLDLFPKMDFNTLFNTLERRFERFGHLTAEDALNGFLHYRIILPILKSSNIEHNSSASEISKSQLKTLTAQLKNFVQTVTDLYLWNQAQVTKGGINCQEVDAKTLESKKRNGLYFAGEVLDMDGDCGGYNLQWAISSGIAAAKSIVGKL